MPGIDYAALRARIAIRDVLGLVNFQPVHRRGVRLRGLCPLRCSQDPRVFTVNLATNRYYCHCCHRFGNQLELWADLQQRSLFDASQDLCRRLNIPVPYIYRW